MRNGIGINTCWAMCLGWCQHTRHKTILTNERITDPGLIMQYNRVIYSDIPTPVTFSGPTEPRRSPPPTTPIHHAPHAIPTFNEYSELD